MLLLHKYCNIYNRPGNTVINGLNRQRRFPRLNEALTDHDEYCSTKFLKNGNERIVIVSVWIGKKNPCRKLI